MRNVMKKAWEIARKGQRKFGGKVKEYFTIALKMAWAIAKKVMKAVKLIGSEKQVKWAESIRDNFIKKLEDALSTVKGNNAKEITGYEVENGIMIPNDFEEYKIFKSDDLYEDSKALVKKEIELAKQFDSAKFFIENRNNLDIAILKEAGIKGGIGRFLKAYRRISSGEIVY